MIQETLINVFNNYVKASNLKKDQRPSYFCLDCSKAIKDFGLKLLTTDEALDIMRSRKRSPAPSWKQIVFKLTKL